MVDIVLGKRKAHLQCHDQRTYVFHAILKTPIPFQDRDIVIQNQTKASSQINYCRFILGEMV